ncbi:MAG: rod shape-determining protein RodA [Alphaproteobacteria bacterium]|nr:rod shape-determining protein RodA [Alphaproteobacteria bacterium]
MSWSFFALICLVIFIGLTLLYSITGGIDSWTQRQLIHFAVGCVVFFAIALSNLRFWMKYAYVIYALTLGMLVVVYVRGALHMGAQRWIDLKIVQIQPSELMKIALVLALARYFHSSSDEDVKRNTHLIIPLILMGLPVSLILLQPDLGTALMLVFVTVAIFWLIGVQWWKFGIGALIGIVSAFVGWQYFLHDYQKDRVLTFLNPERDPLGVGYHIMQSKITLGSGGVFGKGFMQGTQSHLNFIPEKHTDFIFTVLAEEFGLVGAGFLLLLYMIIIFYGIRMSLKSCNFFGKILGLGLTVNFALYVFINISMVMGVMPVVGIPLPLVSYGGTAMLVLMAGFGLIENVHINEEMVIGRLGVDEE